MFFFYKNLIVFHHGDNNFLFWHLYQIYAFYNNLDDIYKTKDTKRFKRIKNQELPSFGKFVTEVLISEAAVHRCFSKNRCS